MKNKTIKKALAIGMSVLMLASTFTPVSAANFCGVLTISSLRSSINPPT